MKTMRMERSWVDFGHEWGIWRQRDVVDECAERDEDLGARRYRACEQQRGEPWTKARGMMGMHRAWARKHELQGSSAACCANRFEHLQSNVPSHVHALAPSVRSSRSQIRKSCPHPNRPARSHVSGLGPQKPVPPSGAKAETAPCERGTAKGRANGCRCVAERCRVPGGAHEAASGLRQSSRGYDRRLWYARSRAGTCCGSGSNASHSMARTRPMRVCGQVRDLQGEEWWAKGAW